MFVPMVQTLSWKKVLKLINRLESLHQVEHLKMLNMYGLKSKKISYWHGPPLDLLLIEFKDFEEESLHEMCGRKICFEAFLTRVEWILWLNCIGMANNMPNFHQKIIVNDKSKNCSFDPETKPQFCLSFYIQRRHCKFGTISSSYWCFFKWCQA